MFFFIFFMALYFYLVFFFISFFFSLSLSLDYYLFSMWGVDFSLSFLFDYVSLGFFGSVSFISGLVFFYSGFYMEGDTDNRRFYWLVFGFVFSMFFLVFSGNFFMVMVGWDGLGLISFCLVVFYSNHTSLESGLVTVFSNRVGDVFFLSSFIFFFSVGYFGSDVGATFGFYLFCVFVFLGAITKSAQLPFSAWLPAAMVAPTPVSSLVHSSTLVTAGVYVLLRFFYVFVFFGFSFLKVFFIGTMVLAGACANLENDFKKVVAMSTLSQLGLMLFILSVGVWVLTFIHVIIHAFFKSMLFLSTGSLMSHFSGGQDSRFFGGNFVSNLSFVFFFVSCVCLAGFPFYIGFYSKDFIILSSSFSLGFVFYFVFLVGCFLTILYSIRLILGAYSSLVICNCFGFFSEKFLFVFSVFFLFFKGWLLGGLFYWFFLCDSLVCFEGLDMMVGLSLLVMGYLFYGVAKRFYSFLFYFYLIGFFRWFSSGGVSVSFNKLSFHFWDFGWLEIGGGEGVGFFLKSFNFYLFFFKNIGLGLLIFCLLLLGFCF